MLRRTSLMKRSAMLLLVFGVLLGAAWAQTQSVLHNFCARAGCADGEFPYAGLVFDQEGNLYGTTERGGAQIDGYGTGVVFRVSPQGKETVLYTFCPQTGCTDGNWPLDGLVFDQKGDLYGTTYYGGAYGNGTVFKLTPKGKEAVLYSFCPQGGFSCTDGEGPWAGVVFDQKGNLYGTTLKGGAAYNSDCDFGCGVVFKVSPEGNETVLYSFCEQANCADGAQPYAGVVLDQKGNLYGTTYSGGNNKNRICDPAGCGLVFKLTPEGKETVLHRFCAESKCVDGLGPAAGVVFDQKGNLYGTTYSGGAYSNRTCSSGCGVVFKLTPKGKETVLYSFCAQNNCADGALPSAGLILDQKGNMYGTTRDDGAHSGGVVFKITP
jgi:uncharacterized repeat protein (TIGR03803 family)